MHVLQVILWIRKYCSINLLMLYAMFALLNSFGIKSIFPKCSLDKALVGDKSQMIGSKIFVILNPVFPPFL